MTGRTDSAHRVIRAPPGAIYRAFIDPDTLMEWLPPTGMHGKMLAFDPRPGGVYRMVLTRVDGGRGMAGKTTADSDVAEGRFVELVPERRIVQSATFESVDPAFAGMMTLTWTFEPVDSGTKVTITCEDVPPGISKADHDAGLKGSLANLAQLVERG
jgi:uncharacterized protein YndB with AHSA1/START domain